MQQDKIQDTATLFSEIYKQYSPMIKSLCEFKLASLPDTVDDCVQEVFIALYEKMKSGETIQNPKAWLYKTAANRIKLIYSSAAKKNEQTHAPEIIELLADASTAFEHDAFTSQQETTAEDIDRVYDKIMQSLSDEDKNILLDICDSKLKLREIAVKYNMSLSAAKQRSVRLKARVRAYIRKLTSENDV